MPLASDRQVNEKPLEIGINSQKYARFDPLDREKIEKRVVREDTVLRLFPALLAHDVLKQVWAVATRFVLARRRVLRNIHRAVKAPEYSSAPIAATQLGLVLSGS
jgi:hypothetical protein